MSSSPPNRVRCYAVGGLTIKLVSDLPLSENTFAVRFRRFELAESPSEDLLLRLHFVLPELHPEALGKRVASPPPWEVYQGEAGFWYLWRLPEGVYLAAWFNSEHTLGEVYFPHRQAFLKGNLPALSFFPTDQVVLARLLADRQGGMLHAAGLIIDGQGYAFLGHSEAGKSTLSRLLMPYGELLCDDRVIVRRWQEGFRLHGTWSHGEIAQVSPSAAPLRALCLLEKAEQNRLIPLDKSEAVRRLPQFVIQPLITADWWEKTLDLVGALAREIPVFRLQFTRQGGVYELLQAWAAE